MYKRLLISSSRKALRWRDSRNSKRGPCASDTQFDSLKTWCPRQKLPMQNAKSRSFARTQWSAHTRNPLTRMASWDKPDLTYGIQSRVGKRQFVMRKVKSTIPMSGNTGFGACRVWTSVERIVDFCVPNPVQYFQCVIQSDPNPVALSKYFIQSGLYPKKLWLSIRLQWSTQFGYPYSIQWRYFRNPVQSGYGSELQNPVGSRSGNRIMFNTGLDQRWDRIRWQAKFLSC